MEFDNENIVSIEITSDAAAKTVKVGFNPRKVEIVDTTTGSTGLSFAGAAKAIKLVDTEEAAAITNPITYNGDNTITLGVETDLNISGNKVLLLCYK